MFKLIMELLKRLFRPKYPAITKDKVWPEREVGHHVTVPSHDEYGIKTFSYNTWSKKRKIISLKKEPTLSDEIYNFVMNFNGIVNNYAGTFRIHKRVKPENYDLDYLDLSQDERPVYKDGHTRYVKFYIIKHGKHGNISDLFNPEEIKNMYMYLWDKNVKQVHELKMNDLKSFIKPSPAPGSIVIKK